VALKLRDVGAFVRPSIQVLIVPCLQAFDLRTPSYQQDGHSAYLPAYRMAMYWLWYAHGIDGHRHSLIVAENKHVSAAARMSDIPRRVDHSLIPLEYVSDSYVPDTVKNGDVELWQELEQYFLDPYFAPLMSDNLGRLPLTYIATAQHDVLRDDGILYARRLRDANVSVEHVHYEHGYHELYRDFRRIRLSEKFMDNLVNFLSSRL